MILLKINKILQYFIVGCIIILANIMPFLFIDSTWALLISIGITSLGAMYIIKPYKDITPPEVLPPSELLDANIDPITKLATLETYIKNGMEQYLPHEFDFHPESTPIDANINKESPFFNSKIPTEDVYPIEYSKKEKKKKFSRADVIEFKE